MARAGAWWALLTPVERKGLQFVPLGNEGVQGRDAQVRALVGQRRVTVVFDRGGYSFQLFQYILDADFDLITYRKAPFRRVARKHFRLRHLQRDGRTLA